MGKGISISIAADTKDAQRGIQRGLIEPLADASEALEQLEGHGQSAGRVLERTFEQQQRETKELRKDYDQLGDTIRSSGRRGRDFGDDVEHGTDKAKRGLDEFKDEANSTAREAAASFDGSAESAADAFQEVAANAFAGFGPAGAAAGLAAALGLGAALSAITAQQEAVDELKQRFADMYKSAAEEGRIFLDQAQIDAAALEIFFDPGQRADALKDATNLGLDLQIVVRALAGDQESLNTVIAAGNDLIQNSTDTTGVQVGLLSTITDKYEQQLGIQEQSVQAARDKLEFDKQSDAAQSESNRKAKEAIDVRGAALQAYADKLASIPDPVVTPRLDLSKADGDLSRFIAKARTPFEVSVFYKPVNKEVLR